MRLSTSINLLNERRNPQYFRDMEKLVGAMALLAENGFELLDWNAGDHAPPWVKPGESFLAADDWRARFEEFAGAAKELGVRFNQCHGLVYDYGSTDEAGRLMRVIEDRVMEVCAMLGIQRIVYHPAAPAPLRAEQDAPACRALNTVHIRDAGVRAADYGLEIAVENMPLDYVRGRLRWDYCTNPQELIALVDAIDRPNVCICMDVGHAHMMGEDLADSIGQYGDRLRALHISDNDGMSDQHNLPYQGTLDWGNLLRGLKAIRYPHDFTLEVHNSCVLMPRELRPNMVRAAHAVGQWLVDRYHEL